MNIFIRLSFYGKDFYGTQKLNEKRTIQGEFESLLSRIYNQKIKVTICSRLDRGVSAIDYAINFQVDSNITLSHLKYYLQRSVKDDIFIKDVRIVDDSFSSRYSCSYKQYLYLIQYKESFNPLLSPITLSVKKNLDLKKIEDALYLFKGEHDFKYLSSPEDDENTILTIDDVNITTSKDIIKIRFKGKYFLRYQVRFMIGTLLAYEKGIITIFDINDSLNGIKPLPSKLKAEAKGLMLEHIEYEGIEDDLKQEANLFL